MNYKEAKKDILLELDNSLSTISDKDISNVINEINNADRVFFVGVGRVLLSLKSIAKRLAHIGIDTVIVGEITEPAITENDLLIVGSGSGESAFPLIIAEKAKKFGATVLHIGSNPDSTMKKYSDFLLRIPVKTKIELSDEIDSIQPMTSLFEQTLLLLGDIIALLIIKDKNIEMQNLWQFHANLE